MARHFNATNRLVLLAMANGFCVDCNKPLQGNFHADHIRPYSKGGETKIENGQALCPLCNQKKGNKMQNLMLWPEGQEGVLREWQSEAWERLQAELSKGKSNFLCVACPGAGKTRFSAFAAHNFLSGEKAEQIIIVCPSQHLTIQWRDALSLFGIHIAARLDRDEQSDIRIAGDMHGIAVTYHAVGANPRAFLALCRQKKILVIFDEIHHAGENLTWGNAVKSAFDWASFRLLLSGTPFRSDRNEIPFIQYDTMPDGSRKSRADFNYGYGAALRESVVRNIWFPTYDGDAEWYSNNEYHRAKIGETNNEKEASEQLRTMLRSKSWLLSVLEDANKKLTALRNGGHPSAGALCICIDKEHAELVCSVMRKLDEEPVLVTSDVEGASQALKDFNTSQSRWLVAVKMVSEGVDIKRLRVGVYATTTATELYFRQVVGRFVRYDASIPPDTDQSGYLFFPKTETLCAFAQAIADEREHVIQQQIDEAERERMMSEEPFTKPLGTYAAIGANAIEDITIGNEVTLNPELRDEANRMRAEIPGGHCLPWETIAAIIKKARLSFSVPSAPINQRIDTPEHIPMETMKRRERTVINTLANKLCFLRKSEGFEIADIHTMAMKVFRKRQQDMTYEELTQKRQWIQDRIDEAQNGK